MLIEERFCEILKLVETKKTVTVQELTELLDTSESTIRRDLTVLHNKGKLIKVHGGATTIGISFNTVDHEVAIRQDLNTEEKMRIARYAASLIESDDFIYLDAGTTTGYMIDFITEMKAVFVTNAIEHARKLSSKGIKTYLLGGELKFATEATVGSKTIGELRQYNFTKGFFGTNGVSKNSGFTTPDINEAMVKSVAIENTKDKYMLCDVSKFSQISPVTFAEVDDATIITSKLEDKSYKNYMNIVEVDEE
ncbi:DeoR/GlpR family DNA-binding transcription regulator [Anaeromicropila herbilytica]|uniref:Putative HTH-type transcriptional regulator FruR n=1 Tax=Anaeromicropila herbilytica TaxID=2785025 RepID=A0A7R7IEL4_9FIRM|nr:DeoR/GlpR family DNA-binding transcription regulator [Anaeromicropila herbilytica]BCN32136.1 putative HTH-type transcriptional regulator FruR [Anaeromicropila herbilytica]